MSTTPVIPTALIIGLLGAPQAVAGSFGVIGDSLSAGLNADDRCEGVFECVTKLGATRKLNFADGQKPWSLFNRLREERDTLTRSVSAADSGARWQNALGQARKLTGEGDLEVVHIELGGNDVCADDLPSIEKIETHVNATLTHLTRRQAGVTVIVSEVPDVVRLRSVMRDQPHFLFETFQDLWDLNYSRFRSDAIDEVCAAQHGAASCSDSSLLRQQTQEAVRSFLENDLFKPWKGRFPCQRVLGSDASAEHRQNARRLNRKINELLAKKALAYNGRNGSRILLANNVEEHRYTRLEPSKLDGFHLGREGHEAFAELIWDGFKPEMSHAALVLDLSGDQIPEYAVVTVSESGAVRIRIADTDEGRVILAETLDGARPPSAIAVVHKHPDAGGPALAFLESSGATPRVEMWAAKTGTRLNAVDFQSAAEAQAFAVIEDLNGNGLSELAVLAADKDDTWVHIRDAVSGAKVGQLQFSSWGESTGMFAAPDLNANLTPEIGVVKRRNRDGRVRLELRDAATGVSIRKVAFGSGLTPIDQAWIPDLDGDLLPEIALLLSRDTDQSHLIKVKDVVTKKSIREFTLPKGFAAEALAAIADVDGNGVAEIAVLGLSSSAQTAQVLLRDSLSAEDNGSLSFGHGHTPLSLTTLQTSAKSPESKLIVLARDPLEQLRAKVKQASPTALSLNLIIH